MKISIVVPAYNEEKEIVACLQSIQAATEAFVQEGWSYELIVCNNNSSDRTAELAARQGATVVFESINQIGRARNCGAAAAKGDWLVFIDADSHPSGKLFSDVARIIKKNRHIGGGATVRLDSFFFIPHLLVTFWNFISRLNRWAAGSFIFCPREAFLAIGGFDTRLFASEELDLSKRLNKFARHEGKKGLAILHRNPLVTSSRKVHLYSYREHGRFMLRTVCSFGATLNDPKQCFPWYDGRR